MTDEEIFDKMDEWHNLSESDENAKKPLHEYLGMSWEEYKNWAGKYDVPANRQGDTETLS